MFKIDVDKLSRLLEEMKWDVEGFTSSAIGSYKDPYGDDVQIQLVFEADSDNFISKIFGEIITLEGKKTDEKK